MFSLEEMLPVARVQLTKMQANADAYVQGHLNWIKNDDQKMACFVRYSHSKADDTMYMAAEAAYNMAYLHYAFPDSIRGRVSGVRGKVDRFMHVTSITDVLGRRLFWMSDVGNLLGLLSQHHVDDLAAAIFHWAMDNFYADEVTQTRRAVMVQNWEHLSLALFNQMRAAKPDFQGHGRVNFMHAYGKAKYPYLFDCIWIFHAPWYVRQGWSIMRFVISEKVHKMYKFLTPSEYEMVDRNFRDPTALPADWPTKLPQLA